MKKVYQFEEHKIEVDALATAELNKTLKLHFEACSCENCKTYQDSFVKTDVAFYTKMKELGIDLTRRRDEKNDFFYISDYSTVIIYGFYLCSGKILEDDHTYLGYNQNGQKETDKVYEVYKEGKLEYSFIQDAPGLVKVSYTFDVKKRYFK